MTETQNLPVAMSSQVPFAAGMNGQQFEPLIDIEEAARLLGGIHIKTLQRRARAGEIPGFQIGRLWYFRVSELNRWLVSLRQPIRPQ